MRVGCNSPRYRLLQEGDYLPLAELVAIDRAKMQGNERIGRIYSQSAGLTHFLMDGLEGTYRIGLVDYLTKIYIGRNRRKLSAATGTSLPRLDSEYADYLRTTDVELIDTAPTQGAIVSLCLGKTRVTDVGIAALPPQPNLQWLDLAGLPVTDEGLRTLIDSPVLRQVNPGAH